MCSISENLKKMWVKSRGQAECRTEGGRHRTRARGAAGMRRRVSAPEQTGAQRKPPSFRRPALQWGAQKWKIWEKGD